MKNWFAQVKADRVEHGQIRMWRLGQSGFMLKSVGKLICLDLYLTDHPMRMSPSIVRADEIDCADIVFGSHDHADHIDRGAWPALMRASSCAVAVVPDLLRARIAGDLGIEDRRIIGLNDGETVEIEGVHLTGIASAHEFLDPDPETGRYPCMGCLLEFEGIRVYQPGDTCIYEGLAKKLRKAGPPDVMILPINGRDGARYRNNIIGNMTFQEAVDLAGQLRPRLTVPAHYDMFRGNLEDPGRFADYMRAKYPDQNFWIGEIGEHITLSGRGG